MSKLYTSGRNVRYWTDRNFKSWLEMSSCPVFSYPRCLAALSPANGLTTTLQS